jgi:hypothetical protein
VVVVLIAQIDLDPIDLAVEAAGQCDATWSSISMTVV